MWIIIESDGAVEDRERKNERSASRVLGSDVWIFTEKCTTRLQAMLIFRYHICWCLINFSELVLRHFVKYRLYTRKWCAQEITKKSFCFYSCFFFFLISRLFSYRNARSTLRLLLHCEIVSTVIGLERVRKIIYYYTRILCTRIIDSWES